MVIPLNVVDAEPAIELVPLKVTVFVAAPLLKVPLLVQVPATLMLPVGAVKVPLMVTLLKALTLDPEIVVVPPKIVVADPAFSVPLFTRLPLIWKLEVGVRAPVMVIAPKVGVALPDIVVVPEKVMVLEVSVELALLTKFPLRLSALVLALNVPLVSVNTPFTVISLARVSVADPPFVKLFNAVLFEGSSAPELIGLEIL
jgi:hypothetical protein